MVDENLLTADTSQARQHSQLSSSSCDEVYMDDYDDREMMTTEEIQTKIENSYEASTSSPESGNETSFNFHLSKFTNEEKTNCSEKKVHWNPSQVHALLDCIEKRMSDFRRKSVHKSVWLSIGKEMIEYGDFSIEHCYNKWKNLRRDIRLFTNSNNMQKLSIRNAFIMERVQKMVNDIGYEGASSSRKSSSSPISPNICDPVTVNDANAHLDEIHMDDDTTKIRNIDQQQQQKSLNNSIIEETIVSLLSDPAVSQAILVNPKLIEEILPGIDISGFVQKIIDTRSDLMSTNTGQQQQPQQHPHQLQPAPIEIPHPAPVYANHNSTTQKLLPGHQIHQSHPSVAASVGHSNNGHYGDQQQQHPSVSLGGSWPHQLYELLHSFRDEESRQIQRLDQVVSCIQLMQESTKRRLNTINQLLSLAGLLMPQK